jgi:hypothetical protein
MTLIGYGIGRVDWHIGLPAPAEREEVWVGQRFIFAGCALSLAAGIWSHFRGNPVWVSVCIGLPAIFRLGDDEFPLRAEAAPGRHRVVPAGPSWRR